MCDITLIMVGDELLEGDVADGNSLFAASFLRERGFPVTRIVSVRDDVPRISETVINASTRDPGIVIISGGLGPTVDDRTREALASASCAALEDNAEARAMVEGYYRKVDPASGFPRKLPSGGERQYLFPSGAVPLANGVGVAPGIRLRISDADVFAVPGVPREFAWFIEHVIAPHLAKNITPEVSERRFLRTTGITESRLFEKVKHLLDPASSLLVSFLPTPAGVDLIFKLKKGRDAACVEELDALTSACDKLLTHYVYSRDGSSMEQILGALLDRLGSTLALAESCTGGLAASRMTDVPGISSSFLLGVVAYSNDAKEKLLGVPTSILESSGAVSEEAAKAMSRGVRERSGADIAVSITGIAGPGGGTGGKPVGTVYLSLCSVNSHFSMRTLFRGSRSDIKFKSSQAALDMARRYLLDLPGEPGTAGKTGTAETADRARRVL